jgi:putative two-component system response regulator
MIEAVVAVTFIIYVIVSFAVWTRRLAREVAERRKTENELRASQQRLELAMQCGNLGYWDINLKQEKAIYSRRFEEMLGYEYLQMSQERKLYIDSIHKDDRDEVLNKFDECRLGKIKEFSYEYRIVTVQGDIRWMISRGAAVERDEEGVATRIVGVVADITKRKLDELNVMNARDDALEARLAADQANLILEEKVAERTRDLQLTQDITIQAMASLAETRDNETGLHIRRTQNYIKIIAELLAEHPRFCDYLDSSAIDILYKSAPLHDIGKVGIPDSILLKQGKLTSDEFEIMKKHAQYGYDALLRAEESVGYNHSISFLKTAGEIALSHHEKWDGSGYPQGLAGDDIPLSARLMAIADVYDALVSKRIYKKAFSHEEAVDIIRDERGTHFDPDVTDVFLANSYAFNEVAIKYAD